jgi:tryptophan synthase alpha chain
MSNIASTFASLRAAGRKAFIPFVSAGDPDISTSKEIVLALAANGADLIELGVPFSDPMADGPTIQASSMRALENGVHLGTILEMVKEIRQVNGTPIVLFSYLNPLHRYGIDRLAADAAAAGIDGVLVTDAIDDEAAMISVSLNKHGIDLISLIAPTSTDERLKKIAEHAGGFIYAVSRAGVTGARQDTSATAKELVERVRKFTGLPVAVGFGISTREQIEDMWQYADGAVVGSAIVAEIERSGNDGKAVENVAEFVRSILPPVANAPADI